MKKYFILVLCYAIVLTVGWSQSNVMTPEQLIELKRVSAVGLSQDGKQVIYKMSAVDWKSLERTSQMYSVSVLGGGTQLIDEVDGTLRNRRVSPNGQWMLSTKEVKLQEVHGWDHYEDVPKSNVLIYDQLNYRHWDVWEDGSYSHVFIQSAVDSQDAEVDLMEGEPFDCPQKPFGGDEDFIWSPDSKKVFVRD